MQIDSQASHRRAHDRYSIITLPQTLDRGNGGAEASHLDVVALCLELPEMWCTCPL